MGKWGKASDAKASGDSLPTLPAGKHKIRITKVKDIESRKGNLLFIPEYEVLQTTNEEVKVGGFYSQVIKFNDDMGPINVKRFVLASEGYDPNDEKNENAIEDLEDVIEYIISDEQPLAGLEMEVTVDVIITQKEKKPFPKHIWHPVEKDDDGGEAEAS